jgi:hypothetical protein
MFRASLRRAVRRRSGDRCGDRCAFLFLLRCSSMRAWISFASRRALFADSCRRVYLISFSSP